MPILPSGGARFIEPASSGRMVVASQLVLRQTSTNVYEFTSGGGAADLELADITGTGVYETIPAGTSPTAPRVLARQFGGGNIVTY